MWQACDGRLSGVDACPLPATPPPPLVHAAAVTPPPTNSKRRILFVCSRNRWRSPTAETLWRTHSGLLVRSAGTSAKARRKVSLEDIRWAEVVMVMENKHKARLFAEFGQALQGKTLHVLDIPDEYKYMDAELVEQLRDSVTALLDLP